MLLLVKIMPTQVKSSLDPIESLKMVRRSTKIDRNTYQKKERPISAQRLFCLLKPNLKQPIFIIGAPRSGTTFLGSCFAVLPEISYHFEPVGTKFAARNIYEGFWDFNRSKRFYKMVYAWLSRQHLDGDLRFAEKTPRNCFLVDFLAQAFPDSQFIHIIRDGRDAALSYCKKPWLQAAQAQSGKAEPGGYAYGPYARFWVESDLVKKFETTSDIHRCIWAWRRFTESALASVAKLPGERYFELRYEDLVRNPADEANRLLNFLNIQNDTSSSLFHAAVAKANPSSVGNWQKELSAEQLKEIDAEAGELLRKLGYLV